MSAVETDGLSVTYSSSSSPSSRNPELRLIHYNDVYHVEPGSAEPVGGVPRFQSIINYYQHSPKFADQVAPLTFFSGDAFNPSLESTVTKGRHMVPFLNRVGTDVACLGVSPTIILVPPDFGVAQLRHLNSQCRFPWLLANVLDPALGEDVPIGNLERSCLLVSGNGVKVGVIGLGEREWLDTINALPPNLIYKSASQTAKELAPRLREQGAEIVIAVTHQREPNDIKLAKSIDPGTIDIILGGHDHFYAHSIVNSTHILRSGTDFKQLSYIEAFRKENEGKGQGWDFNIIRRDMVRSIPEDSATVSLVNKLTSSLKAKLEKPIGYTVRPLDGRFTTVRLRESNLGNFVCDLMRFYYNADCAIMAGGTIRGDQIYPPGILRLKDVMNCFPFEDPVVLLRVTGQMLLDALENGVSLVPALEGRFPQVSNINFRFKPSNPRGSRITSAGIGGQPIQLDKPYVLATRGYMARGKDGFRSLLVQSAGGEAEEIVSEESGLLISTILRQYFLSLKVVGTWQRWSPSLKRHWGRVHSGLHGDGRLKPASSSSASSTSAGSSSAGSSPASERVPVTALKTMRINNSNKNNKRPGLPRSSSKTQYYYGRFPEVNHIEDILEDEVKFEVDAKTTIPNNNHRQENNHHVNTNSTAITNELEYFNDNDNHYDQSMDSDSDSDPELLTSPLPTTNYVTHPATSAAEEARRVHLARRFIRKWMRVVGISPVAGGKRSRRRYGSGRGDTDTGNGSDNDGDDDDDGAYGGESAGFTPSWTPGIAPRNEGRIVVEKGC